MIHRLTAAGPEVRSAGNFSGDFLTDSKIACHFQFRPVLSVLCSLPPFLSCVRTHIHTHPCVQVYQHLYLFPDMLKVTISLYK